MSSVILASIIGLYARAAIHDHARLSDIRRWGGLGADAFTAQ